VQLLVEGRAVADVEVARTAGTRRRGLLGRDGVDGAFWLEPCKQVHTFRMRFAIDVVHVARDGTVLAVTTMPPGRLGRMVLRSRSVVEVESGRAAEWGLVPGVRVELR
jgi:uncharacterized protein